MSDNKTKEETFCKVYTEFYGEPVDNIAQLVKSTFSGEELLQFCEFYASQQAAELELANTNLRERHELANKIIEELEAEVKRLRQIIKNMNP